VIHYGFPSNEWQLFENLNYKENKRNNSPVIIGTISRLEKQKNLDSLLLAFQQLKRKDLELRIIGEGTQKNKLISLSKNLNLENRVKFLGKTKKVVEFLDSIDIFILASKYEGFGIVLVEAASRGKPIIASKLPVCIEVLGVEGALFFDPNNIRDIVSTIQMGLEQLPMNRQVSNASAKIRMFDLETLISKTDQVYEKLN
jgi:glycosyltransferase involved in cell wall biosynthesis